MVVQLWASLVLQLSLLALSRRFRAARAWVDAVSRATPNQWAKIKISAR